MQMEGAPSICRRVFGLLMESRKGNLQILPSLCSLPYHPLGSSGVFPSPQEQIFRGPRWLKGAKNESAKIPFLLLAVVSTA